MGRHEERTVAQYRTATGRTVTVSESRDGEDDYWSAGWRCGGCRTEGTERGTDGRGALEGRAQAHAAQCRAL